MKKRILSAVMAGVLLLVLCACNSGTTTPTASRRKPERLSERKPEPERDAGSHARPGKGKRRN